MKINVGCGEYPAPGWLNLDTTHDAADLIWDCTTGLPVSDEPITRIYAGHVLEHLHWEQVTETLRAWRQNPLVNQATQLAVVGPDCDAARLMHAHGEIDTEMLRGVLYGAQRWDGDAHLWYSNAAFTTTALQQAGWDVEPVEDIQLLVDDWPVTALVDWQFALLANPT